ncbi:MAG: diguanylate cyclase [Treponema sp.]|nr:diguanylate cyclase [Candidatus Treponema equifaecale]
MENRISINPEIDQFNSMVDFIQKNYSKNLSIQDLAKSGGVCRSKCFSLFNKFADKTPKDFLNDYRLDLSADFLCSSRTGVSQISSECGFSSQSYFSKLFLKKYGVSPVSYRKKTTGKESLENQKEIYEAVSLLAYYFYKIIKVNLKDDSYSIIKPDANDIAESDQSKKHLNKWLREFSISSKIHPEDRIIFNHVANIEYARKYFLGKDSEDKKYLHLKYRRLVNGKYRWVLMELIPAKDFSKENPILYLYIKDINDEYLKEIEKTKNQLQITHKDMLTGLLNKYAYENFCADFKTFGNQDLGVIYADINGLKYINDNYSHDEGDRYLQDFAEILMQNFRPDSTFRIGGDEFLIILKGIKKDIFEKRAASFFEKYETHDKLSVSIGSAWKEGASRVEDVTAMAEKDLQVAKRSIFRKCNQQQWA